MRGRRGGSSPTSPGRCCRGVMVACFWWWPGPLPGSLARLGRPFSCRYPVHLAQSRSLEYACWFFKSLGSSTSDFSWFCNLDLVHVHSWVTYPGSFAPTEAPGPTPNALLIMVGVGPNKCTSKVAKGVGPLSFPLLLHQPWVWASFRLSCVRYKANGGGAAPVMARE